MEDDTREYLYYAGRLVVKHLRENFVHVSLGSITPYAMAKMNRTDIAKCIDTLVGVWIDMGRKLQSGLQADAVPESPKPDDRARCTACGCVISDAEHTDNGGKCEECASFIFAGSTPPARKELPAGDISVKPSREICISCGNDIPEADRDIYGGCCKDCYDVKGGPPED